MGDPTAIMAWTFCSLALLAELCYVAYRASKTEAKERKTLD